MVYSQPCYLFPIWICYAVWLFEKSVLSKTIICYWQMSLCSNFSLFLYILQHAVWCCIITAPVYLITDLIIQSELMAWERERERFNPYRWRERESLCRLQLNNEVLQFLSWTYFVNLEPLYEGVYAGCSWIMKYYSFKYEPILLIWFGVWTFIFVFRCEEKVEDSCSPSPNLKS